MEAASPAQDETATVEQNVSKPSRESDRVPSLISEGKEASMGGGGEAGNGDEHSGVGSSNPPHRTNSPGRGDVDSKVEDRRMFPATTTPDWLAADMVALANIHAGMTVLEPSAGEGSIVEAIHRLSAGRVTAVELNAAMAAGLRDMNCRKVVHGDFLQVEASRLAIPEFDRPVPKQPEFDRVVMNPPRDALPHLIRAADLLAPGGRLVALLHLDRWPEDGALPGARRYRLDDHLFGIDGTALPSGILVWNACRSRKEIPAG